jgi:hypothetical protein
VRWGSGNGIDDIGEAGLYRTVGRQPRHRLSQRDNGDRPGRLQSPRLE